MCQVTNGKDKTMELTKKAKSGCSTNTGALKADFAKVCLEKAQRTERSKDEWVTDNKYFMVFYTQVMLHNKPMQLVVYSRPIILISHVLQDCTAKATLIWNAAFPLENGKPYEEQKEVPWSKVAEVLDALFFVNTERHLMPDQLNYLASIAFRKRDVNTNFSEMMISRNKLLKDHLHKAKNKEKENSSRNFSFWKWFYANMNLLKERLKQEWKDGIIYGFVSKDTAKQLLSDQQNGTFLLRFSESSIEASMKADICGCITVAVITRNPATGDRNVFHVKDHLATKDIMMSSLAQILDSFEVDDELGRKQRLLHYLWPAKPLEEVFKTYLPQHENEDSTYKRGRVTITILLSSDSSHLRHASNMPMSPFSAVSDLDDMSVASPGSAVSVQSQGIQSPIMTVPPPSNIVTISNASGVFSQLPPHIEPHVGESDEAFVPGRIALQEINLEEIDSCLQQLSNGDVMLSPDFQMDAM
ncbi:Signal transducer and activator of transcription 1-alpha/beta [Lamellibrachia satsuma]|nr:Signal transducer and activator of transcription 1-alpha/beta [Lamellibrachia satsuma]